jgi:bifunctional non-homologous end joining protein LigD
MSSALRELTRRVRRFDPCLPRPAKRPPGGSGWIHEIKHDGFRIIAHRDADGVRLVTCNGYDFADRFPLIVEAIAALPARSCVVDGEAIAVDVNGLSVFDLIRYRRQDQPSRFARSISLSSTTRICGARLSSCARRP